MGKRISTKIFCFIVLAILLPSSLMLWNVKSTMEKAIHEEVQEKTAQNYAKSELELNLIFYRMLDISTIYVTDTELLDTLADRRQTLWERNSSLNRYTEERGKASDVYFFQSANGQHRDTQSVRTVFITKILPAAGINPNRGGVNVRVHDLRHTFACHVLNKLVQKGADPFCALPYLSVYMGHKDIKSTELYLRLTEDRFKEITDAGHCIYEGLGDWDD